VIRLSTVSGPRSRSVAREPVAARDHRGGGDVQERAAGDDEAGPDWAIDYMARICAM